MCRLEPDTTRDTVQALAEKNGAIAESERCQLKLSLANRLITALASEGQRWAETVQQLRKDYQVCSIALNLLPFVYIPACILWGTDSSLT